MKLVLLPGLDGTGNLFKPLISALPEQIETVVISYPSNQALGYKQLVDYVIPKLPKEQFIILAESFSGPIAHSIIERNPEMIKTVFFVATFLQNPRSYTSVISNFISKFLITGIPIPNFIFKFIIFGSSTNNELITLFSDSLKQVSPTVISFRLKEISKLDTTQNCNNANAIYIQATDDRLVPDSCVELFNKIYKRIETVRVPGSHFILQTNPHACAEIIKNEFKSFIKSL